MREIKFRAWDNDNKIMVDVYEMEWMEGKLWATCIPHFETTSGLLRKRVLCTSTNPILQYTGLKDKNGTEIYEGDRVKRYHIAFIKEDVRHGEIDEINIVIYNEEELEMQYGSTRIGAYKYYQNSLEVTGNIHEVHEIHDKEGSL